MADAQGGAGGGNGVTLGYDIKEVNTLMQNLANKIYDVKTAMVNNWPTVKSVLSSNWKGPDEEAAEKTFVENMEECYQNVAVVVSSALINVYTAADVWRKHTISNMVENGISVDESNLPKVEMPGYIKDSEGHSHEVKSGAGDQNLGLQITKYDGGPSVGITSASIASSITTEIDSFKNAVKTAIEGLYNEMESSVKLSFLGASQAANAFTYIKNIGEVIGDVATHCDNLKNAVAQVAGSYVKEESERATDFSKVSDVNINWSDSGQ